MITNNHLDQIFDVTQLAQSRKLQELSRSDKTEGLKLATKQFESFFVDSLMKSMRDANKALGRSSYFQSHDIDTFQEMFDQQLSQNIVRGKGLGIAKMLETQLSQNPMIGRSKETLTQMVERISSHAKDALEKNTEHKVEKTIETEAAQVEADEINPAFNPFEATSKKLTQAFDDPVSFVKTLWSDAVEVAEKLNLDPKLLLAQAALETGWGKSIIEGVSGSSHNLFNIKADSSWTGNKVLKQTLEYQNGLALMQKDHFRGYQSFGESFKDYLGFLQGNPRYEATLGLTNDPKAFLESLQDAGYATDPKYADKVYSIYRGDTLNQAINTLFMR